MILIIGSRLEIVYFANPNGQPAFHSFLLVRILRRLGAPLRKQKRLGPFFKPVFRGLVVTRSALDSVRWPLLNRAPCPHR